MRFSRESKRAAIGYWERRRIVYNLAIIATAYFGYTLVDTMNWVGDPHETDYSFILPRFAIALVGANVCYSFCYTMEFLCGSDDPASAWLQFGRSTVFVAGLLFAMFLALASGGGIAILEWEHRVSAGP